MPPRGLVETRSASSSDTTAQRSVGVARPVKGAALELRFFGELSVHVNGVARSDRDFQRQDARRLLCALVLSRTQQLTRQELCQQLWPLQPMASARTKLTNALFSLRKALEPQAQCLYSNAETVAVRLDRTVFWDVGQFEQHLDAAAVSHDAAEKCEELEQALALYRGDLLETFLAERWLDQDRELLRARYRWALDEIVTIYTTQPAQLDQAIAWQHQRIDSEPTLQSAHQTLLQLLLTAGHYEQARLHYKRCRDIIATELGQSPSPEIQALYAQIKAHAPISSQTTQPPQALKPSAQHTPAASLPGTTQVNASDETQPPPSGDFFGRERDIDVLLSLLREYIEPPRIITITGFGGIGKTTLARQLVARWMRLGADDNNGREALFLDLRETTSPGTAAEQIKQRLNLPVPLEADDQLIIEGDLHTQLRALLVIDNYEQLAAHAHLLTTLVRRCPYLKVVVTSRVPLRIKEELVYPLATLPIKTDAIALFVQRARLRNPGLSFDSKDLAVVTSICKALDGLPLAIELAAARTRLFSPRELQQRLSRDLRLLHSKPSPTDSNRIESHRSLWSILEWTINLLSPPERELIYWLRVFQGGFTYEAAEAVFAHRRDQVADLLEALIDHQLIVPMHDTANSASLDNAQTPQHRWTLLETVSQYLNESASRTDSESHTNAANEHARYYVAEAQRVLDAEFQERESSDDQANRLLLHDSQNLLAAIRRAYADNPQAAFAAVLVVCEGLFWSAHHTEVVGWIETLLKDRATLSVEEYREQLDALEAKKLLRHDENYARAREMLEQQVERVLLADTISAAGAEFVALECQRLIKIDGDVEAALTLATKLLNRTDMESASNAVRMTVYSNAIGSNWMAGDWSTANKLIENFRKFCPTLAGKQLDPVLHSARFKFRTGDPERALQMLAGQEHSLLARRDSGDLVVLLCTRVEMTIELMDIDRGLRTITDLESTIDRFNFHNHTHALGVVLALQRAIWERDRMRTASALSGLALLLSRPHPIPDRAQLATLSMAAIAGNPWSAGCTSLLSSIASQPTYFGFARAFQFSECLGCIATTLKRPDMASDFFQHSESARRSVGAVLSPREKSVRNRLSISPLPATLPSSSTATFNPATSVGKPFWRFYLPRIHELLSTQRT